MPYFTIRTLIIYLIHRIADIKSQYKIVILIKYKFRWLRKQTKFKKKSKDLYGSEKIHI
jgi:hypothetical protein